MAKSNEKLKSTFKWVKGEKVFVDHPPMLAARERDYLLTQEHSTIPDINPNKWGGDGATG